MTWLQIRRHRRQMLSAAARGASLGLAAICTPVMKTLDVAAQTSPTPPAEISIRPNIYSLDPAGPEVASLRRGVATMMQISQDDPDDPRGWTFQANIHGAPVGVPLKSAWRQCQHGSYFFFPWHRIYLYWFERILRWAAKDDSLALPYWDYSVPEHRILPAAFRQPASDANPLYREERDPMINAGTPPWSVLAPLFDHLPAFANTKFFHDNDLDTSFGGGKVPAPMHHADDRQSTGLLEATPHGQVHVMIGGRQPQPDGSYRTEWMGDIDLAARDPIFWLHHANIDRLWIRWLMLGDGRANPVEDSVWMNTEFGFFDENGDPVTMTASEVLSTSNQLGYVYEDILTIPSGRGGGGGPEGESEPPTAGAPPTGGAPRERMRGQRRSLLGASRAGRPIALGSDPITVPIRRGGSGDPAADVSAAEAAAYDRLVLTVEGLRGLGVPGVSFEVYLHGALSPGALPSGDAFVGLLSLFGLQPEDAMANGQAPTATQSFDVTTMVRAAMADPNHRGRLSATFLPRLLTFSPAPAGTWATADRVALSAG
jgi:tyrosinase